jgi:hypothetical protein
MSVQILCVDCFNGQFYRAQAAHMLHGTPLKEDIVDVGGGAT